MDIERAARFVFRTLGAAAAHAPRVVLFRGGAVEVIDAFGRSFAIAEGGDGHPGDAAVRGLLRSRFRGGGVIWDDSVTLTDGYVFVSEERDDAVAFVPKTRSISMEALVPGSGAAFDILRSFYDQRGIDVIVAVEGVARATRLARAATAELTLSGRPCAHMSIPGVKRRASFFPHPQGGRFALAAEEESVDLDGMVPEGGHWAVVHVRGGLSMSCVPRASADTSRLIVVSDERAARHFHGAKASGIAPSRRPVVVAGVVLEKNGPTMSVVASRAAAGLSAALREQPEAPWEMFRLRRKASPERAPKTWHRTKEAVAEAFVERVAPKGYVSGRAIYFHGPVAWSAYDRNPIAAFVEFPEHGTVLFLGRAEGLGGTLAGTVSSAASLIESVARRSGMEVLRIGDLGRVLTMGGRELKGLPSALLSEKPRTPARSADLDVGALMGWAAETIAAAEAEIEDACRTSFPTMRKAAAWRHLASVARLSARLGRLTGREFPGRVDIDGIEGRARLEQEAAAARRNGEKREESGPPPPALRR